MMGKTHVIIGIAYGTALLPALQRGDYSIEQYSLVMVGLVIGSLLPDLDHPQSTISRMIPIVGGLLSRLTRHRGILHSIMGVTICWLVCVGLMIPAVAVTQDARLSAHIFAGMMIGYVLHVVADSLTKGGVRLFYPLRWTIKIPVFRTGGYRELVLRMVLLAIVTMQIITLFID